MGRMKEELMSLEERILAHLELASRVTLCNAFFLIETEEAGLHLAEITRDIVAELERSFEEAACEYCRGLGWREPR